ncbi:MAG TPA: DegT/DnrJ/EryC1/StrS family aminotransferase, partial [Candidatus Atribacteria bacterium]|nr:DegT/DnrJ/EryC1/StrS family aminotransferase [Candidatus Atribacteria bacterium]
MDKTSIRNIPFSPPDISDVEIEEVIKTLKSGWITTGPRTKELEKRVAEYVGVNKAVCLNSCTAAMELALRILGVGPGD